MYVFFEEVSLSLWFRRLGVRSGEGEGTGAGAAHRDDVVGAGAAHRDDVDDDVVLEVNFSVFGESNCPILVQKSSP